MTKLFNHTVQPLGSTTSPVEDLALEVADAFDKIEDKISTEPNTIPSLKDVIGNPTLHSIKPHKVSKEVSEVHNMLERESNIVLDNIPDKGSLVLSYINSQGTLSSIVEIDNTTEFTRKDQFKLTGKVVKLNIDVPKGSSVSINASYRTTTFSFNNLKLLPNVFKKLDGTYKLTPLSVGGTSYNLDYGTNISDKLDEYKLKSSQELHFYQSENDVDWKKIDTSSYNITNNIVSFESSSFLPTGSTKVLVYTNNTTLSEVVDSLYKEFIEHNHSNSNLTKNIDTYTLTNRVSNIGAISYKSDSLNNYQFPQYFNREGHNPNLDGVYENAILGDIFLSRKLSDDGTKYKGLDEDSNSIIFGDPASGHRLMYSHGNNALTIDMTRDSNGLKIKTSNIDSYGLSINSSYMTSRPTGLYIKPENNHVFFTSSVPSIRYRVTFDNITVDNEGIFNNALFKRFRINKVQFTSNTDTLSANINSIGMPDEPVRLNIHVPTNIDEAVIEKLTVGNEITVGTANINGMKLGKVVYRKDGDNAKITSTDNAIVHYESKVVADNLDVKSLSIGDVVIEANNDSNNPSDKSLKASSKTNDSTLKFGTKTNFSDASFDKAYFGGIQLKKGVNDNLEILGEEVQHKVVVHAPVEFKNVTTGIDSKVTLNVVESDAVKVGNHIVKKGDDNNTLITPKDPSLENSVFKINSKSYVKDLEIGKATITDGSLVIGNSKIHNNGGITTITPTDKSNDILEISTKTEIDNANINTLTVDDDLFSNHTYSSSLTIGGITSEASTDKNMVVKASTIDKKVIYQAPVEMDTATIKNLTLTNSNVLGANVTSMRFGNIVFSREIGGDNATVTRSDDSSKVNFQAPVHMKTLEADNFTTSNINIEGMTLGGFKFTKDGDNHVLVSNVDDSKFLKYNANVQFKQLSVTDLSSQKYTLYNKDKILIDEKNYLGNVSGRLTYVHDKSLNFAGTGKGSGLSMSIEPEATPAFKQYIASNNGTAAIDTDKNMFMELNTSNGLYFIRPIDQKVSKNGVTVGFNDPSAQVNINDLTRWFRANLYAGKIEATSVNAGVSDGTNRNGINIGSTRISVIGPEDNCPDGLTVFESTEGVHIVRPMAPGADGCRNLSYQETNTGSINVKGDGSVDGSFSVTEDAIVNGTLASGYLTVTNDTEMNNVVVSGNAIIAGKTTLSGEVELKNTLSLTNELISTSRITGKSIDVTGNSVFGRSLEVGQDLNVVKDTAIGGGLAVRQGITSDGVIKSKGMNTGRLDTETLQTTGDATFSSSLFVQGRIKAETGAQVGGNFSVSGSAEFKESITARQFFTIDDATVRGKFTAMAGAEVLGKSIVIGSDSSIVQIDGRVQINTKEPLLIQAPLKVYNKLTVIEGAEINGTTTFKGDVEANASFKVNGGLEVTGNAIYSGNLKSRSINVASSIEVENSVIANNLTSESMVISSTATVANLTISNSLSMSNDTQLVAGNGRFSSLSLTNSEANNNISGSLTVARDITSIRDIYVGAKVILGSGNVTIDSNGLTTDNGKVSAGIVKAGMIVGSNKVQAPPELLLSNNPVVNSLTKTIPNREFVRLNDTLIEGVCIYSGALIAPKIIFNELIPMDGDGRNSTVDIVAKYARYAGDND